VKKLLARGKGWLEAHPERELIVRRYLRHQRSLARQATAQLIGEDEVDDPDAVREVHDTEEAAVEQPISLNEQRLARVVAALKASVPARGGPRLRRGRLLQRVAQGTLAHPSRRVSTCRTGRSRKQRARLHLEPRRTRGTRPHRVLHAR